MGAIWTLLRQLVIYFEKLTIVLRDLLSLLLYITYYMLQSSQFITYSRFYFICIHQRSALSLSRLSVPSLTNWISYACVNMRKKAKFQNVSMSIDIRLALIQPVIVTTWKWAQKWGTEVNDDRRKCFDDLDVSLITLYNLLNSIRNSFFSYIVHTVHNYIVWYNYHIIITNAMTKLSD